jgi:hypothetical protein
MYYHQEDFTESRRKKASKYPSATSVYATHGMHIYIYACVSVYACIYTYIEVHIYIHIYTYIYKMLLSILPRPLYM